MLELKEYSDVEIEKVNIKKFFPDISKELLKIIEDNKKLKKEIVKYITYDRAGIQYNSIRICKIPEDPSKLEKEVEDLEIDIEIAQEDENESTDKIKNMKRELFKKRRELEKLKKPYKYIDDICESYKICPLAKNNKCIEGEPCPYERFYVEQQTENYLKEFDIDIAKQTIDKTILSQLVLSDLIIYRASRAIASTSLINISEKIGEFGSEFTQNQNQYILIREKELKNRDKLLTSMLGTRESKKRYKIENTKNSKQKIADSRVAELIRNKERIKNMIVPTLVNIDTENEKQEVVSEAEIIE